MFGLTARTEEAVREEMSRPEKISPLARRRGSCESLGMGGRVAVS